ncbi:MAG: hypothetical protein K2W96_28830 [Gemmataceae bacterium]|nr:hypothetical protein [Gemmataceae bacterium]
MHEDAYSPSMRPAPQADAPGLPERVPGKPLTLLRLVKGTAVFLVVAWHLFFLVVRNPLDLWKEEIKKHLKEEHAAAWKEWGERCFEICDHLTNRFANLSGCEQRWVMFSPPMARGASFLGIRFEFTDGSTVTVPSENEPRPEAFFRFGNWQTRKFEESMIKVPDSDDDEFPMWKAFVRHKARAWKAKHPDDPREMKRVVLLKRRIHFPGPDDPPGFYRAPAETDMAAFTPDGEKAP